MTRSLHALPLLLALLGVARAQPSVDAPTGLAPRSEGLTAERLQDLLRAVESATTTIAWDTAGDSRRDFGTNRMVFELHWAYDARRGEPVVVGGEIRPAGGSKSFRIGKLEVYKLKINRRGEIRVEKPGIDTTVYKIARNAKGDIEFDIPWLHGLFVDTTIPAETFGPFELTHWPPSLNEVIDTVIARGREKDPTDTTRHEGTFTWRFRGRTRRHAFPISTGDVTGVADFDIRGAGVLRPDGTFRTVGDGNTVRLVLDVGGTRYERRDGVLKADLTEGGASLNGRYAISVPHGGPERLVLDVEGDLHYRVRGRDVVLSVPSGARVVAGSVTFAGDGRLRGSFRPGDSRMALEDGTYTLDLTGPLALNGIRLGALELEDLRFADAAISSQGSLDEFSREGVRLAGAWRGTLERDARGMANVLLGQDGGRVRATVAPGSRLEVDLPDVRYAERFRDRSEPAALSARGRLSGEARLEGVRGGRSGWTVDAPAGTARFALELDADLASGVRSARGTIDAKLDAPARLSASSDGAGLPPERPLVRTQPPAPRRHRVARGDTLSRIARRYGVPLADLRAANGMGPSDSLIRVGEELTIPGEASVRPRPRPRPRPAETGRRRADFELAPGSRLSIDLEDASLGRDGLRARGTARGDLVVSSAQLATRDLEATILGRAQAALAEARFDLGPAADGAARLRVKPFRVPVRIDLSPGSRVLSRGGAVDVRLDRPGSSARFAAVVEPGPDGGLRVTSLEDCDLVLESSAAARFAGRVAEAPGAKTVRYQGRMVLVPGGIDFYGDVTVRIRGDEETPALRIRW